MIEILIRLEDELYEQCQNSSLTEENEGFYFHLIKSVANGTLLPEGCDIQRIIPKKVDVQKWIYTKCPNLNCDYELSTHHGDGYYSIEYKPDFCPNCGQALLWESEE